jgi:hypothetical protein
MCAPRPLYLVLGEGTARRPLRAASGPLSSRAAAGLSPICPIWPISLGGSSRKPGNGSHRQGKAKAGRTVSGAGSCNGREQWVSTDASTSARTTCTCALILVHVGERARAARQAQLLRIATDGADSHAPAQAAPPEGTRRAAAARVRSEGVTARQKRGRWAG